MSQNHQGSNGVHRLYRHFEMVGDNVICTPDNMSSGTELAFAAYNEGYFTVDSSPVAVYNVYDSPVISTTSTRDTFSPQPSHSYVSDPHHSSEHMSGSPASLSSVVDNEYQLKSKLQELERSLLGPEDGIDSHVFHEASSLKQDLRQVLVSCAQAVANEDSAAAGALMDALGQMVSISGSPIERLAAYMLEGLRARLESSGFNIYKKLRCEPPTSPELMSYMTILYLICPYYQFAYKSSNVIIHEAMKNENRIHIIDFQIAMGTQWMGFIESVSKRPGGPPFVRITGVDDSNSAYARGGGLEIVGKKLAEFAESRGVPFEFHAAAVSGCRVKRADLRVYQGEAIAVTFPYMLHHMPDESVSTENHRDRLLRLIKSLDPKVVTLLEQESNTNTTPIYTRFVETLEYYTAMFESIDVARDRNDKERISAEQHCLARDIVNMIACEGEQRVERHELLGKWKARLSMAGFVQCPLSPLVGEAITGLLKGFNENYRLMEWQGSLYLGWKDRALATCSAWR